MTLYDITGRRIVQAYSAEFSQVDLSGESQGLYFVRIESGDKVLTAKFVKE